MIAADDLRRRAPPRTPAGWRPWLGGAVQVLQAAAVFALIFWVAWRGANALDYRWQWARVVPYIVKVIDGEVVPGPLLRGLASTLRIAVIAGTLAILFGTVTALARMSASPMGRGLARVYLQVVRNTPLLVQLFLVYFVLAPIVGLDRFWSGVLTLALFEGAFASEIIRGAILAVDRGQGEAADAIGLTRADRFRFVILPQALPLILPPLTGLLISTIKHGAILAVIAMTELTTTAMNLIASTFMAFEIWIVVALLYLVPTVILSFAASVLEYRLARPRRS